MTQSASVYALSDESIVRQLQKEDNKPELFATLYLRYAQKIHQRSLYYVKDMSTADDITHNVFIKLIVNIKSFKNQSSFSTWLFTITNNTCLTHLRQEQKSIRAMDIEDVKILDMLAEVIEDEEDNIVDIELFQAALEQIAPTDKQLLQLRYHDKYSIKQIHTQLNISESAAKMRLKRAKMQLLRQYENLCTAHKKTGQKCVTFSAVGV